jgi:hypothetical protein
MPDHHKEERRTVGRAVAHQGEEVDGNEQPLACDGRGGRCPARPQQRRIKENRVPQLGGSMWFLSKLVMWRMLVVALAFTLLGFGIPALQARAAQTSCPTQTCPVDSKVVRHAQHEAEEARARAQKQAAHAGHEAEEARARAQKKAEHDQHEAAEAYARQQNAYAHALHEAREAQERATAKLAKANALYVR